MTILPLVYVLLSQLIGLLIRKNFIDCDPGSTRRERHVIRTVMMGHHHIL